MNVDKNRVYIKNTGTSDLKDLSLFINNVKVDSDNPAIPPNTVGTLTLNDAQLSMLPDPAELRVTSTGSSDKITANFYGNYMIAYWKADEGFGSTVKDSSGKGNDGITSGAIGWAAGKYGSALDTDSANEYAEKDWTDFDISEYTIEFWMKADTVTSGWRDMVTIDSEVGRFHLDSPDNSIIWYNVDGTGNLDSNFIPTAGQWYHVVGTHKSSTAKIYINDDTAPRNSKSVTASTNSKRLKVGTEGEVFDGALDEIRILNVARSMAIA